jgi:hypothetical protein
MSRAWRVIRCSRSACLLLLPHTLVSYHSASTYRSRKQKLDEGQGRETLNNENKTPRPQVISHFMFYAIFGLLVIGTAHCYVFYYRDQADVNIKIDMLGLTMTVLLVLNAMVFYRLRNVASKRS